jgi:hypothetical protein
MKKLNLILIAVVITASVFAQAPQKMSYQAVIRNSSNELISSAAIAMRISILQGSSNGMPVYEETQTATSNVNGLISLEIGAGTVVSGDFSTIDWASGPYFIKTETDPTGGVDYTIVGTSELLSVPYALFAGNGSGAGNTWTLNDRDIFNINAGNVGIGTSAPTSLLTLKTPINTLGFTHIGGEDSIIVTEAIGGVSASMGTSTFHAFRLNAGGLGRIHIYPAGEVVVGSNATGAFGKLTVQTTNNTYGISHLGEGGNILATRMGGTSAGIGTFSNTHMRIFANGNSAITITGSNGNVGVGIEFPANKFEVNGTIRCKEVIVETTNWPDYVFKNDYKLPLLSDVEKYIKQNNRLPNIPSDKEMEKLGLHLGDTQKQMMEKIEELTLYLIDANKRIEQLEQLIQQKE